VVIGVREDGQKVMLAVKNMGGESAEARRAVLDDLIPLHGVDPPISRDPHPPEGR
jgi:hypothetical protein